MATSCLIFEDPMADQLRPMNLARPTCTITCGAMNLFQLAKEFGLPIHHHVRNHLRAVMEQGGFSLAEPTDGPTLFLNAALVPDPATIRRIQELVQAKEAFLAVHDQRVTAAYLPDGLPAGLVSSDSADVVAFLLDQRVAVLPDEFATLEHTYDVIRHHSRLLPLHLERLIEAEGLQQFTEGVFVGEGAQIARQVEFDASGGPVLVGRNARIKPFSYVLGPVRIGDNALIIDHASIKHGTVLGHTVKAGGEIEESILEPYSNKQHHGFLGHAYVGSWVNLGAGTSNSDLKNTYGEVSIDWDGRSKNTGLQFLGCVIGDYTKTAINTSIFTGKVIGVASFLYGFISTNVPSFTNFARSFGQVTEVGVEVAIKAQTRAAARRNVKMTSADVGLMESLFELTRKERQLSAEQIVL